MFEYLWVAIQHAAPHDRSVHDRLTSGARVCAANILGGFRPSGGRGPPVKGASASYVTWKGESLFIGDD